MIIFGIFFAIPIAIMIVLGINVFIALLLAGIYGLMFVLVFFISFLKLIGIFISWNYILYAATDKRVVYQYGVFSRMFKEAAYDKITDTLVLRPFFERILGCGTIAFNSAGSSHGMYEIKWVFVKDPMGVKQIMTDLVEKRKGKSETAPPPPPPDDSGGGGGKFCGKCGAKVKTGNKYCEDRGNKI